MIPRTVQTAPPKTLIPIYQTPRRHTSKDRDLNTQRRINRMDILHVFDVFLHESSKRLPPGLVQEACHVRIISIC
jgi:hypothetical protein